ncbi:MAG: GDSL-type esterase/lipase family protein [Sorangiineae bacterium]|nr:GDSL-type esterase/lipase family protein [Sorangiineae bacterium]
MTPSLSALGVAGAVLAAGLFAGAPAPAPASNPVRAAPSSASSALPPRSAPAPSTPPPERPRRKYVVAALGDSLTDARSHGGRYLTYLAARCPESRFDNYGVGGNMVNQMRRRFARDVLGETGGERASRPRYTHLIVFGGVNDLYSNLTAGRTNPRIEEDLDALYRQAHAHGMRVVAITVTPWGGFTRYFTADRSASTVALNRFIVERAHAGAIEHAVDAYPLLSCGDPERLCPELAKPFKDGLHFGPAGHEVLGRALHEQVFSDCR